jgi:hypothetical protein
MRSRATGDLNDFNSFFGNFENPIIRPNEGSRLPWDAPNRFLFWGDFNLIYGISVAPVLEIRNGFLFRSSTKIELCWRSQSRGRFPTFGSFDLKILKTIRLPVLGDKHKARWD